MFLSSQDRLLSILCPVVGVVVAFCAVYISVFNFGVFSSLFSVIRNDIYGRWFGTRKLRFCESDLSSHISIILFFLLEEGVLCVMQKENLR